MYQKDFRLHCNDANCNNSIKKPNILLTLDDDDEHVDEPLYGINSLLQYESENDEEILYLDYPSFNDKKSSAPSRKKSWVSMFSGHKYDVLEVDENTDSKENQNERRRSMFDLDLNFLSNYGSKRFPSK